MCRGLPLCSPNTAVPPHRSSLRPSHVSKGHRDTRTNTGPGRGPSGLMRFEVRPCLQWWCAGCGPSLGRQHSPSVPAPRAGGTGSGGADARRQLGNPQRVPAGLLPWVPRQEGCDGPPSSPRQRMERCQGCNRADLGCINGKGAGGGR